MRFRKKPVVVEATQWLKHGDHPEVIRYRDEDLVLEYVCHCGSPFRDHGEIQTLEGYMMACPGDYIITGVKGEHYPCKPDIFAATYEPVDE